MAVRDFCSLPFAVLPTDADAKEMLDLAAKAAFRATGHVEPNPLVGCVLVQPGDGPLRERVIGIGHHRMFGGPHAEVEALRRCRELGNDPRGATAYVTLEPCNGHGWNPPCVKALVEAEIARVVCAAEDGTEGKGGGAAALRAVGVPCDFTDVSQRATDLSAPWRHRQRTALPWVIAKWAQTIDGKLATRTEDSRWISNERSRLRVHRIRSTVDAVMVGRRTVEIDNPMLTTRNVPERRRAARVVVAKSCPPADAGLRLYATARERPTIVVCNAAAPCPGLERLGVALLRVEEPFRHRWLRRALIALRELRGVHTLLVEGGPALLGSLFEEGLVNEVHVHMGPIVLSDGDESASLCWRSGIGGAEAKATIAGQQRWRLLSTRKVDDDVQSVYRRE